MQIPISIYFMTRLSRKSYRISTFLLQNTFRSSKFYIPQPVPISYIYPSALLNIIVPAGIYII